ncbi:MAG: response regulator transcription factor [Alistipes sp.]|nr:response regulator transcription factor [Alistipes sp.]
MDETNRPLILVVEDEPMLARIVCDALRQSGYDAASAPDGERGLAMFSELRPALVVTDVMMPRSDGFRLTRRIRSVDREVPILFLSARSSSDDVVDGFASGGDDYLRKPFAMNELLARIEALLRRREGRRPAGRVYAVGDYTFDAERWMLSRGQERTKLSAREAAILAMLVEGGDGIVENSRILGEIWGDDSYYAQRSLNVYVTRLRHRLAADCRIEIVSVRNVGYRLSVRRT